MRNLYRIKTQGNQLPSFFIESNHKEICSFLALLVLLQIKSTGKKLLMMGIKVPTEEKHRVGQSIPSGMTQPNPIGKRNGAAQPNPTHSTLCHQ
jgi:hypothetical protein